MRSAKAFVLGIGTALVIDRARRRRSTEPEIVDDVTIEHRVLGDALPAAGVAVIKGYVTDIMNGMAADFVKRRMHGQKAHFTHSINVNHSNICVLSCKFCAFAAKEGEERAYLMTPAIVEQKVKEIICEQLGVSEEEVTPEASFIEDLGADSLDTVELVMALEEEFECEIPDEEAEKITTVQGAIDYIKAHVNA